MVIEEGELDLFGHEISRPTPLQYGLWTNYVSSSNLNRVSGTTQTLKDNLEEPRNYLGTLPLFNNLVPLSHQEILPFNRDLTCLN